MGVILLRHTKPAGAQGLCYGRSDLAVGPCFAAHAAKIAQALPQATRIVTSPLARCAQLAQYIATARALPLTIDPRLTEMDFGAWEGMPWSDISRAELDAWAADLLHARPHGGESVAELRDRALPALRDHAAPDTLVVTHHGVIKCARWLVMGEGAWQSDLKFGAWQRFDPQVFHNVP
jgi:alpha-ribazole phosphatase